MKRYNGLVQLEVKKLAGLAEAELVKRQAMLLPQTFAAFCGSSGKSVKIWVCFALPDGNLPKREQEAALFHAHAYRLALLSAVVPVSHYLERAFTDAKLPDDAR